MAAPRGRPRRYRVTRRQNELLFWLSLGLTKQEIAVKMFVTPNTVGQLAKNLYVNLDVTSGPEAVRVGFETGLLSPRDRRTAEVVTRYAAPRGRQPAQADQRVP